jgi:hypothetical protein
MDIFTTTSHLKSKLSEIGLQLEDINSTDDNANVANTAGIVTYLLTSNSKNQTLKTVGGITSIAAILYGSSERRKSNRIKKLYKQNILDLVGYVANFDGRILKSEKDAIKIREFLYCLLQISHYLDTLVSQDVSIVRGKGHLGKKNIEILTKLKGKKVNQYDLNGNLIGTYDGIRSAARSVNLKCYNEISKCCRGKKENYCGYIWKYA